jgi:hypothetical protein
MSVKVEIFRSSAIDETRVFFGDVEVVVDTNGQARSTRVRPSDSHSSQEPMWNTINGRAGLKTPGRHLEGVAQIVVTRRRILLLIDSGMNAKGLETRSDGDQKAVVSVDRTDLRAPEISRKLTGKIKRVECAGASDGFTLVFPSYLTLTRCSS